MKKDNENSDKSVIKGSKKSATNHSDSTGFLGRRWYENYARLPINFSTFTGLHYPFSIPRLTGNLFVGRLFNMLAEEGTLNNLIEAGKLASQHPSGMCYYSMGFIVYKKFLLITKPRDLKNFQQNSKHILSNKVPVVSDFLGPCILTDAGDTWHQKRRVYNFKNLGDEIIKITSTHITSLQTFEKNKQTIDLKEFFTSFVVDITLKILIGNQNPSNALASQLLTYFYDLTAHVFNFRSIFKWLLPEFIRKIVYFFSKEVTDFDQTKSELKKSFEDILRKLEEEGGLPEDSMFLKFKGLSPEDAPAVDAILGDGAFLLVSSITTTASALCFAARLLHDNPRVQTKLYEELKNLGNQFSFSEIEGLPYLNCVLMEILRLFPTVPLLAPRELSKDWEFSGIPVYKGDVLVVSPLLTQRDPTLWTNADKFVPERFADKAAIGECTYFPHGLGTRQCAGSKFSKDAIKIMIASMYKNFYPQIINESSSITLDQVTLDQGALAPKNNKAIIRDPTELLNNSFTI